LSAQFQYLPHREKERSATEKGLVSRLLTSILLLITGFILILLWISFPALRIFLLIIFVILLFYAIYRAKGKI
ncbi:MAG: hypothetical protein AMJ42_01250, partial [Deltaproteobacteria bacterium DG_8]